MSGTKLWKAISASALAILLLACTAGAHKAQAQCLGCPGLAINGQGYWVNYDYVYGPCFPSSTFFVVSVQFSGYLDQTSETSDGHFTYDQDPGWGLAHTVTIDLPPGVTYPGFPATFPIPCPKTTLHTPCGPDLEVEIRCNPCIEIRLKI